MMMINIPIPFGAGMKREERLRVFAEQLKTIQQGINFKVSSRGWCYLLENMGAITKAQFDRVQDIINECRKKGHLPIRFVAEEEARSFSCVEEPDEPQERPADFIKGWAHALRNCYSHIDVKFWKGQKYFIQMLVEKIDLKTLFEPICEKYHIAIATSKGWSSILQRAEIMERFSLAEAEGMIPVLLYCGDFDPVGIQISELLMHNFEELSEAIGWSPDNLIIQRFGLNHDFIKRAKLSWIDNLITGSGLDLSDPRHKDHDKPWVRDYISKYGVRKCEANALVVQPNMGRELCEQAVISYLGTDALDIFAKREKFIRGEVQKMLVKSGLVDTLVEAKNALDRLDKKDLTDYDGEVG